MAAARFIAVFENRAAVQSLYAAMDLLIDAAKDRPWDNETREAMECLEVAANGLTIQRVEQNR